MQHFEYEIGLDCEKKRLDVFLAQVQEEISRSYVQKLIDSDNVHVNGAPKRRNYRLKPGDHVEFDVPDPEAPDILPEAIPLCVVFEDRHLIVVDKPAGLVVHPAPGHSCGTLVNALLHHCHDLAGIGGVERPGIVHRLDKDTSGLVVVAKSASVLTALSAQFKNRLIEKTYLAIVRGRVPLNAGMISGAIGRHRVQRKKMSVDAERGRDAETRYEVLERFGATACFLRLRPKTGRTHQLRVHLASLGHPILGDALYGGRGDTAGFILRQALHAHGLAFEHPETHERMTFSSPLPEDMVLCLDRLRARAGAKPV
jgi:23S rRNA pseudouridine1911/1915/1917 synthase